MKVSDLIFLVFEKSEKPKAKQKEENANRKRQRNNTQTVGRVMISVMFLAFGFWQLFGFWLFAFFERCLSCPPKRSLTPESQPVFCEGTAGLSLEVFLEGNGLVAFSECEGGFNLPREKL